MTERLISLIATAFGPLFGMLLPLLLFPLGLKPLLLLLLGLFPLGLLPLGLLPLGLLPLGLLPLGLFCGPFSCILVLAKSKIVVVGCAKPCLTAVA